MKFFTPALLALIASASASAMHDGSGGYRVDVTSALKPRAAPINTDKSTLLLPVDEFHPRLGRRETRDDSSNPNHLSFEQSLLLRWAATSESGGLLKAQMNITSDDGKKLLFMNRFQGFTSGVDCTLRDGDGLAVTFKTRAYLEAAKKQWGWLTEDVGNTFWMITNHKDCPGRDVDQYVPYEITDVDYDDDGLTAEFVRSRRMTLKEVLGEFNFEFTWGEHAEPEPSLGKRFDVFDGFKDGVDKAKEAAEKAAAEAKAAAEKAAAEAKAAADKAAADAQNLFNENWDKAKGKFGDKADALKEKLDQAGNTDQTGTATLDMKHGEPGKRFKLTPDALFAGKELWCVDCYTQGSIALEGKIRMEKFELKEASYHVVPKDVLARVKLNAILSQSPWSSLKFPVFTFPLPGAISIPMLFEFGPIFRLDLSFGHQIGQDVDFNFGWEATLPNGASYHTDVAAADVDAATQADGWDKAGARTLEMELNEGKIDIDLMVELTAVLSFGYNIMGLGGYEAAIKAPLPRWSANYTTIEREDGACEQTPGAPKTAIQVDQTLSAGINLYVGPNAMTLDGKKPLFQRELFKKETKIASSCTPIADYVDENAENEANNDPEIKKLDAEQAATDAEIAKLEAEMKADEAGSLRKRWF